MEDIESKLEGTLSLLGTVVVQRGRELKGEGQKVRWDGCWFVAAVLKLVRVLHSVNIPLFSLTTVLRKSLYNL